MQSIIQCPGNPWPWDGWANWELGSYWPASGYGMNGNMFPSGWCGGNCDDPGCANPQNAAACLDKMVNISDIGHPNAVLLVGESPYTDNVNNPWGMPMSGAVEGGLWACHLTNYAGPYAGCSSSSYDAEVCNCLWGFFQPNGVYNYFQVTPGKLSNCGVSFFHGNKQNTLMVDGHVGQIDMPTMTKYALDMVNSGMNANEVAGRIFWGDGKALLGGGGYSLEWWYFNQYPGAPWPYQ
jgi:prepilin-type processing-associated H-X9-DG protein